MQKATPAKEVIVTCPNTIGAMAKVTSTLAEAKINIEACCCYSEGGTTCNLHFVTSDTSKTVDLCNKAGWTCKTNDVVCCELSNTVGTLATATTQLSTAGINTQYCYFTASQGSNAKVYFCTSDTNNAIKALC